MEWRTILAVVLSIFVLVIWQYGQYVFSPAPEPPRPPEETRTTEQPPTQTGAQPRGTPPPSPPSLPRAADIPPGKPAAALQTLNERLQSARFTPSVTQLSVTERERSGAVQFEYEDPTGWRVVKRFELRYGSYAMEIGVTVEKPAMERAPTADAPAAPEESVILENDLLRVKMTTHGARIKELWLKKYAAPWPTAPNIVWRLDFLDFLWGGRGPRPSPTVRHGDAALVNLIEAPEEAFSPALEVSGDGRQALLRWGPGFYTDLEANGSYAGLFTFSNGERWLDVPKPGQPPLERTGTIQWTAVQNKYYAVAVIPRSNTVWTAVHQGSTPQDYAVGLRWPLSEPRTETRFTVYTGPKELEQLAAFGVNGKSLAELVYYNYGWVRVLHPEVWLLHPLQWLYRVTHNFGVAIIILTIVVKLIFYPLSVRSFKSMQAMQRVQPQMKRLQDMYKQDRQKLNEEMMKLYREQKVNPMGGCLPMVVQIPVFIALYQVLYTSIELRQADFFWWIKDLSAPDHPMAIVMGASMVIQQWMTPTTGDPRQAKMMLFMPIIFTFMFLNFPVGLVIYWLINNILSIAQQYTMLRMKR